MSEKSEMSGAKCNKDGWVKKKLGEVCEIIGGSTPKTKVDEYWDGEYFWVTPAELKGDKWISSTVRTITQEGVQSAHLQLLPKGTVLLSSRAPIGKLAITKVPMFCNQGFKNLVCSESIFNEFAYYFLLHNTELLQSLGVGATFKEISKSIVGNISILLPSIAEQQHIISELDCLNGIIENQKEQLKQLDELAQSIFYDMFGDPVENEKGWKVKEIGDVATSVNYGTSSKSSEDGKYKYLRMNNLTYSGFFDLKDLKYITVDDKEYEKCVVRKGDILFNRTNSKDLVGKTALFDFDEEMIIAGYIIRVRVDNQKVIPIFVSRYMNTPYMKNYLSNLCKGAVNQANINSKELKNIPLYLPPLSLQQAFASKIEAIEHQKGLIKQSLAETENLFNSRMDYYFG